jgi:type I restriction enzyme S subunit
MVKFRWEKDFKETIFGEIPKDWSEKLIKDVGDVGGGSTPSTKVKEYWDGTVAWITPDDLANHMFKYISYGKRNITERAVKEHSLRIFPSGTVLLTSRAPIGYLAIAKNPVTTNQGFKNIIPKDGTNSEFLFYLLKNIVEYLRDIAGGSTFSELTAASLREVKIPYPNSEEQSRIAIILSYFDNLIENKIIQNEVLEKTAMAIFKSWFMDFEPFKDEEFTPSELGEIPKSCKVEKLGEVVNVGTGGSAPQEEEYFEDGSFPFVRVKHLTEGPCVGDCDLINEQAIRDYKLKRFKMGSVVFPRSGESIKSGKVNILPFDAFVVNHLAVISDGRISLGFIYCYVKSMYNELLELESGTSLPYLRNSDIQNKLILVPPPDMQDKFHSLVDPLFQKIILNQRWVFILKKVRDLLLPLLVFGRLRVEEI